MANQTTIEKLRKLVEHERSARQLGSLAEAEAFSAKVQELLLAHNLEMSEVSSEDTEEEGDIDMEFVQGDDAGYGRSRRRTAWMEDLANAVARNCFCESLIVPGSNTQVFAGRPLDRVTAAQTFRYLANTALHISKDELKSFRLSSAFESAWDRSSASREWRNSWLLGFSAAISSRVSITRRNLTAGESGEQGLVLIQRKGAEVTEWMENRKGGKASSIGGGSLNSSAYRSGYQRGEGVGLKSSAGLCSGGAA